MPTPNDSATRPLSPCEEAVLEVVGKLKPDDRLSGEEIAERAGYAFGGWFRDQLSHLASEGRIRCYGRQGYGRLPDQSPVLTPAAAAPSGAGDTTAEKLAHAVARLLESFAGEPSVEIKIRIGDTTAEIRIEPSAAKSINLSPTMERKILAVMATLQPGETLLGKQIAAQAGYKSSGNIRRCLSELVKTGKIRKTPTGYARA